MALRDLYIVREDKATGAQMSALTPSTGDTAQSGFETPAERPIQGADPGAGRRSHRQRLARALDQTIDYLKEVSADAENERIDIDLVKHDATEIAQALLGFIAKMEGK
jgi:hypothetical protein